MAQNDRVQEHPARSQLETFTWHGSTFKCFCDGASKDIAVAVSQGPHVSVLIPEDSRAFKDDLADKVKQGFEKIGMEEHKR